LRRDEPAGQPVREVRAKAREERKDWADSIRRNREESRKLEAEQKELRRQLDEDMRRMSSRYLSVWLLWPDTPFVAEEIAAI
jgi:hypothetical protein